MKKALTLAIAIIFFSVGFSQSKKQRCFIIGYISDTVYSDGHRNVYSGGEDTCLSHFPNLVETILWIENKHHCENVKILGISEYSVSDRKYFWKPITISSK